MKGVKILVVDDEEMLRDLLRSVFEGEGATVTVAENGARALTLCRERPFDVVITDVRMPGGDGIHLIRGIRQHVKPLPLMFVCSGFNDLSDDADAAKGVDGHFEKPFLLREILNEVRKQVLSRPRSG